MMNLVYMLLEELLVLFVFVIKGIVIMLIIGEIDIYCL